MQNAQTIKSQAKEMTTKKEAPLPTKIDLEAAEGQGSEFVTARDQKLPILKILYANSPVLDESDGKYIETAKQGDIYSETSGTIWKGKEGLYVVPCLFINTFNEWKDKGEGIGRPVQIHTDPAIMRETSRSDDNKDRLPNGNYVEDTGNHFVYILDKNYQPVEQALIAMKSTQKKKSKTWCSMMESRRQPRKNGSGSYKPPYWSTVYKLTTTKESNSQNSWYGWVIDFHKYLDGNNDAQLLAQTKSFYESAMKSDIFGKIDFNEEVQKLKQVNDSSTPF